MNCEAVRPFTVNPKGLVIDANRCVVLVCGEDTDCPMRFADIEVDADPHFMCPNCARIGQRMVEAKPRQCGLEDAP